MREAGVGRFTFAVLKEANKTDIKLEVERRFGVSATGVTTIMVKGKTKRVGKKMQEIVLSPWKKAVVTLAKGQKIDLFETQAKE